MRSIELILYAAHCRYFPLGNYVVSVGHTYVNSAEGRPPKVRRTKRERRMPKASMNPLLKKEKTLGAILNCPKDQHVRPLAEDQ